MRIDQINSVEHALAYIVDCTLATVEGMAATKSRKKYDYKRQKSIAQKGISWLIEYSCEYHHTRVADVMASPYFGDVDAWASAIEAKCNG